MRYLIISDIHGNLTAFQTVLKDAGKLGKDYDFVWCLGDVVGRAFAMVSCELPWGKNC